MRRHQKLQRDLVGGGFLDAAELVELALGNGLAKPHRRHAGLSRARHHGGNAHHHRQQHGDGGFFHAGFAADQMPRLDVAGLMRHHADQFIGGLGRQQDAREYEDIFAAIAERGKGVHFGIAHQPDLGGVGIEPRRLGQRRFIAAQHLLGFGVAQDADIALRHGGQARADEGEGDAGGKTKGPE